MTSRWNTVKNCAGTPTVMSDPNFAISVPAHFYRCSSPKISVYLGWLNQRKIFVAVPAQVIAVPAKVIAVPA